MSAAARLEDLLLRRANDGAMEPLYLFVDESGATADALGAAELRDAARALAARLARRGVRGRPVMVIVDPFRAQPVALFACFMAGAAAVPLYPPPPGDPAAAVAAIARVARSCAAPVVVTTRAVAATFQAALTAVLGADTPEIVLCDDTAHADDVDGADIADAGTDGTALILYTSGSTGNPKGVVISHASLLANMRDLATARHHGPGDIVCSWLPHANIAGLYLRLYPLVTGSRAVLMAPGAVMSRPALWLHTIARHRATISAAPDFAYRLITQAIQDEDLRGLDLTCWRMVISGGEVIRAATVDDFFTRLAPTGLRPEAFAPYYGLTETLCTSVPAGSVEGTRLEAGRLEAGRLEAGRLEAGRLEAGRLEAGRAGIARSLVLKPRDAADRLVLVGNGPPLGRAEVIAVDPATGRPAAAGVIGELWTRGPGVTSGYWGETGERFWEGRLPDGGGPYFRTGDLGLVHQGQVFVTGRLKELLIVRGKNHYPADIEATCQAVVSGLGVVAVAAFTVLQEGEEALGLAFEAPNGTDIATPLLRAVRPAVARAHGLAVAALFLLPPGTLPRTATGKIARHACRTLAESGAWTAHAAATVRRQAGAVPASGRDTALIGLDDDALTSALLGRVAEFLATEDPDLAGPDVADRGFAELGLSSLAVARAVTLLRNLTGVEPPLADLFGRTTPRALVATLVALMTRARRPASPADGWREDMARLAVALPDIAPPPGGHDKAILLTGATGFLGAWLLGALLETCDRPIVCLVRADSDDDAASRVERALAAGPGFSPDRRRRIVAMPGDIGQPRLGLDEDTFCRLADSVDVIVHNAANVNFVAPCSALRGTNVAPMHDLIRLAFHGGRARTLHFVSTLAVFNTSNRREQRLIRSTDRLTEPDFLYSGYAQSKWTAEALARVACSRGMPLGLHRPGLIIGATGTGQSHRDDFLNRFVKGCIELGRCPDAAIELDLVPVDEVALGIALAVTEPVEALRTWHWSTARPVLLDEFFQVFRARGHRIRPEPTPDWLERIRHGLPQDNALFPVHPFLLERPPGSSETILELFDGLPLEVETSEADDLRWRHGVTAPGATGAVLDRMAAWMEATGFLPRPSAVALPEHPLSV